MLRSLVSAFVVIWLTSTLTFFMLRVLPGDALEAQLVQGGASQSRIDLIHSELGLDDSVFVQYGRFLKDLIRGDLGYSLSSGRAVTHIIRERLQPTLILAATALLSTVIIGVSTGIYAGLDARFSLIARALINLSISTPIYWTGTLAIILFSAQLGWLPASGSGEVKHLVLPVTVLSFHAMGSIARVIQVNIREIRFAPFVQVARSKGLTERLILRRHILLPGLMPVVTVIALQAGFLFSGTVITEILFVRPGIGRLLIDSTLNQDYPVVQGMVILSACIYVLFNTLADVLYRLIDPRVTF